MDAMGMQQLPFEDGDFPAIEGCTELGGIWSYPQVFDQHILGELVLFVTRIKPCRGGMSIVVYLVYCMMKCFV